MHSYSNIVINDHPISTLKYANKYLEENNIKNVNLVVANDYSVPFVPTVFNEGIMIRVFHHLEYPENILKEISRILKKILVLY